MNYKTLVSTKDLDRKAWLRHRQQGIGGSDAAGIFADGTDSFTSPLKVYLDKTTPISDEEPDNQNEAMRQGHDLEEYCASRFEEQTGKKVRRVNAIIQHHQHPFILANIDRRIDNEDAILECKTTNARNEKLYENWDTVPARFKWQCHHYLLATGASRCYLAVLILGTGFKVFTVERDEELMGMMLEGEQAFWSMVESGTPPEFDGSPAGNDILKAKYPGHMPGVSVELPSETAQAIKDYVEYVSLIKGLEGKRDAIKQRLLDLIGEAEYGTLNGETAVRRIWVQGRESIDSKRLRAEKPEVYSAYTKQGEGHARLETKEG